MAEDRTPRKISPGEPADDVETPARRHRKSNREREEKSSRPAGNKPLDPSDDSDRAAKRGPGNRLF